MTVFRLFLQLVVLLGVLLVHSGEAATYRSFAKSHIDFPKSIPSKQTPYCDWLIQRRGLNLKSRICKSKNTFIHAQPNQIIAVCQGAGIHYQGNLYDSMASFSVTHCRSRGRYPNCNYVEKPVNQRVRLGCVLFPVHYEL